MSTGSAFNGGPAASGAAEQKDADILKMLECWPPDSVTRSHPVCLLMSRDYYYRSKSQESQG